MKKRKILIPILTTPFLISVAAIPLISCGHQDTTGKVTINFDINNDGGTLLNTKKIIVDKGITWDQVLTPEVKTKDGYEFYGWFLNNSLIKGSQKINQDVTVIASCLKPTNENKFKWTLNSTNNEACLTGLNEEQQISDNEKIVIPSKITNDGKVYKVTVIGKEAFAYNKKISSVTIPTTVNEIWEAAFTNSTKLEKINIPDSVKYIGDLALYAQTSLKEVSFPDNIQYLGKSVLKDSSSLETVAFPHNIFEIPESACNNCKALKNIQFPSKLKKIGNAAFNFCNALINVVFPETLEEVGDQSFYGCAKLNEIDLPNAVETIGVKAFAYCVEATKLNLSQNLNIIHEGAFIDCKKIESVVLPNKLVTIEDFAFKNSGLKGTITIPASVRIIGMNPFMSTKINKIIVDEENTRFETNEEGTALFTSRGAKKVIIGLDNIDLTNVTQIGGGAFYGCQKIIELTIPSTCTNIEPYAFQSCGKLTTLTFANYEGKYAIENIGEYAFSNTNISTLTLPDTITELGANCFAFCDKLTELTLPKYLKIIPDNAFAFCSLLTTITNLETMNLSKIGRTAFQNTLLSRFDINETVDEINSNILGDRVRTEEEPQFNELHVKRLLTEWPKQWDKNIIKSAANEGNLYVPNQETADIIKQNWTIFENWTVKIE